MEWLVPLPVAVPLVSAALLAGLQVFLRRRIIESLALATCAFCTLICCMLVYHSSKTPLIYWMGGWRPQKGLAVGIVLTVEPLGAGLAALAALLMTAALVFVWHYFELSGALFHVLMLVFLAALTGFCLSGDLFNMFVFFELMGVSAFALTGYKIEERSALQGALSFAITNGIAGFLLLWGIALLYGATGALNLAHIGAALSGVQPSGLVTAAFTLVLVGFFVKAAIVPFHFWLGDAHAVAPTPVCVLLSGVMVELGLLGVARVYWTVFADLFEHELPQARAALVGAGVVTAIVGAVMCYRQRHIKRLLAFSTISHSGFFLAGVGYLSAPALAGASLYILAHGLSKGSLFLGAGILRHRLGTVDEYSLHAKGKAMRATAVLFVLGALALTGLPPTATYVGKTLIEEEGALLGFGWTKYIFTITSAVTGGALLRVCGRVFLGWGTNEPGERWAPRQEAGEEESETVEAHDRTPAVMFIPAALLVGLALLLPALSSLRAGAEAAAESFTDGDGYRAAVLEGASFEIPAAPEHLGPKPSGLPYGILSVAGAVAIGGLGLFGSRAQRAIPHVFRQALGRVGGGLQALHSNHVGDYVAWLTLGVALYGGVFAALLAKGG